MYYFVFFAIGSGDIAKQRKDDIIGYSQVSTMPHDDDIEEMSL